MSQPRLLVQTAPFLHTALSTPRLMLEVTLATVPIVAAAVWFFGITALLVVAAATLGALLTEWAFGSGPRGRSLRDNSALLTGVLLALTLPPGIPLWMAFVGGVAGVGFGKVVWGGLGHNLFNPALVGRAFLQAAFPTTLTTWSPPGADLLSVHPASLGVPMLQAGAVDAVTAATPLARMKFEGAGTDLWPLLVGDVAGSLGETSALLIALCGLVLLVRRAFDWRIPAAILGTVALFATVLWLVDLWWLDGQKFASPWFMLASGGLLFGTVFMATDPVSSPATPRGAWIFGAGIGVLVVLIRVWGGLPEGVMYAILLMNGATPLIERVAQPRAFGRGRAR
jgi:electron transport complex protein RnfD